jgi:hypothetical protein
MKQIIGSQVVDRNSSMSNSNNINKTEFNRLRKQTYFISFVVGFLSSLLASFIFQQLIK